MENGIENKFILLQLLKACAYFSMYAFSMYHLKAPLYVTQTNKKKGTGIGITRLTNLRYESLTPTRSPEMSRLSFLKLN